MLNEISRETQGPRQVGFAWEVKALPDSSQSQQQPESTAEYRVAKPHTPTKLGKTNIARTTGSQ